MFKKILTAKDCADCRLCCTFERYELVDTPVITCEMKARLAEHYPQLRFISHGENHLFRMEQDERELFVCPMLTEHGCTLGGDKPFECEMWPFRAMDMDGKTVIVIDPLCKPAYNKPLSIIMEELENDGLADRIFEAAKKYPELVHPFRKGYPVLKVCE